MSDSIIPQPNNVNKFTFIYALIDPRDGVIKYVGKSDDPEDRLRSHLKECRYTVTLKNRWVAKLVSLGLKPSVIILEKVPLSDWEEAEQGWIERLTELGYPLKNGDRGGKGRSGFTVSEETRAKLREASKRRPPASEETRRKISEATTGRRVTEEAKQKMREAALKRPPHSQAARLKMSLSRKGKPKPEGFAAKISAIHKGKIVSEETRRKLSQDRKGKKPPESVTKAQKEKCSGEGNGRAVLTREKVREIRAIFAQGSITIMELSKRYGVGWSAVERVVTRKTWKNID